MNMDYNSQDIRWQQRFQNYHQALDLLGSALGAKSINDYNQLEKEGLFQRFAFTFELAWKVLKDYLEAEGLRPEFITPREVIKTAFAAGIITDGQVWIDMMLHRNVLAHTYDESRLEEVLGVLAGRYLPALRALHDWLANRKGTTNGS